MGQQWAAVGTGALAIADWGRWPVAQVLLEEVTISPTTEWPSKGPTDRTTIFQIPNPGIKKSLRILRELDFEG